MIPSPPRIPPSHNITSIPRPPARHPPNPCGPLPPPRPHRINIPCPKINTPSPLPEQTSLHLPHTTLPGIPIAKSLLGTFHSNIALPLLPTMFNSIQEFGDKGKHKNKRKYLQHIKRDKHNDLLIIHYVSITLTTQSYKTGYIHPNTIHPQMNGPPNHSLQSPLS